MKPETIVSDIIKALPHLPAEKTWQQLIFRWNKNGLSPWEGGYDVNETVREKVIEILDKKIEKGDADQRAVVRFLIRQEIKNCHQGEMSTFGLMWCYERLAAIKFYEDILLLLAAIDETSFDANCALPKNRLFYNGYENVMAYLEGSEMVDDEVIERIRHYAKYR